MRKAITYSTFIGAFVMVVFLFVTAKSYTQLAFAAVLYPGIAYLFLNLFPRDKEHEVTIEIAKDDHKEKKVEVVQTEKSRVEIADIDKRAFLKLIGATGVTLFLVSLFSKKAQIPFFGKSAGGTADEITIKDKKGEAINPAERQPLDGFQISEIDDGLISYYGFINKNGSWFIMREDTQNSSFRYAKGENGFPNGWNNRTQLKYDYFYNV